MKKMTKFLGVIVIMALTGLLMTACSDAGTDDGIGLLLGVRGGGSREVITLIPGSSVYLTMVRISGGTFIMGSPNTEQNRYSDEGPQRRVTLSGFYIGKYPVTQAQYRAVMGTHPNTGNFIGDNRPVVNVSWYDAIVFCNRLSILEDLTPVYSINGNTDPNSSGAVPTSNSAIWNTVTANWNANGYRLPTEAQWEYACRAGTTTAYNTGEAISNSQANFNRNVNSTTNVGRYAPNAWGLHDMHGNVWDWCWDWYGRYPFDAQAQTNPTGSVMGSEIRRIARGGSWYNPVAFVRSAQRVSDSPGFRSTLAGFRLVRSIQ